MVGPRTWEEGILGEDRALCVLAEALEDYGYVLEVVGDALHIVPVGRPSIPASRALAYAWKVVEEEAWEALKKHEVWSD